MKREREKEGGNCYLFISIFLIWLCSSRYFFSLTLNVKMNTLSLKEREREREREKEREKERKRERLQHKRAGCHLFASPRR